MQLFFVVTFYAQTAKIQVECQMSCRLGTEQIQKIKDNSRVACIE